MLAFRFALLLLATASPASFAAAQEQAPALVARNRIQLNLAGAETVVAAAKKKAAAMGLKCNIAVVDDGGHLLAFARMDGARPASGSTAMTKAVTAATFRQETGPLPAKGEPDILLSLSIQNAAAASGGRITTLKGGVPIVIDGQVIGAVGVGGGSGEQDAEVAKAGIAALLDALREQKQPALPKPVGCAVRGPTRMIHPPAAIVGFGRTMGSTGHSGTPSHDGVAVAARLRSSAQSRAKSSGGFTSQDIGAPLSGCAKPSLAACSIGRSAPLPSGCGLPFTGRS